MEVKIMFPDKESAETFLKYVDDNPDILCKWIDEDFYFMYSVNVSGANIDFIPNDNYTDLED